jgi:hypothetical protein
MTLGPTDTTSSSKTNAKHASLFCDHQHDGSGSPMVAQARQNISPNSPFTNYLLNQSKQTYSKTSLHLWSLMSMGKTANDGTVLVFTKEVVNVIKVENVLITCKSGPILIRIRDNQ